MIDIHTTAFRPTRFANRLAADSPAACTPIHLPHPERICKLDAHESTRRPADHVLAALRQWIEHGAPQWYPDTDAVRLRTVLADYTGLPFAGIDAFNGSNEALACIARAFIDPEAEVLVAPPTHNHFCHYVESCGGRIKKLVTNNVFAAEINSIIDAIGPQTCMVYLVNPNDPTGVLYTPDQIETILRERPGTGVVVDEAFYEFCGVTVAPLVEKYANLIVVRSFSFAFGLAGIRLGYVLAQPGVLAAINSIRAGQPVSAPAQIAGTAALEATDKMSGYVREVTENMRHMWEAFSALGVTVVSSPANFILVKVAKAKAATKYLADKLIFVRNCDSICGLDGYVRITVGDRASTARVLSAFLLMPQKILGAVKRRRKITLARQPENKPSLPGPEHPAIDRIISDLVMADGEN